MALTKELPIYRATYRLLNLLIRATQDFPRFYKYSLGTRIYPIVDYILGLEKEDIINIPSRRNFYKTFSSPMQRILTSYCRSGGSLLVSGAYTGSDMNSSQGDREFIRNILKYRYGNTL